MSVMRWIVGKAGERQVVSDLVLFCFFLNESGYVFRFYFCSLGTYRSRVYIFSQTDQVVEKGPVCPLKSGVIIDSWRIYLDIPWP